MAERNESETFQKWLDGLRNDQALAQNIVQVERLVETGKGDVKHLGEEIKNCAVIDARVVASIPSSGRPITFYCVAVQMFPIARHQSRPQIGEGAAG